MFLDQWLFGVVGPSILWPILFGLVATQVTFVSITLYLHRHSAHRALELHPALKHFFRFWLWISTGMATKSWTAVHRKHHALTETKDDPHSPKIEGLANIVFKGAEYYRDAITPETLEKYGKGTPDDWLERHVYSPHNYVGISVMAVLDLLLFGLTGVIVWGVQMMWTPFWAAGVVNGIGHAWGYRNFECPDAARNIVPWGFFICGEELHNNHHTYPNSAKFSVKPWEFDLGWVLIRMLETLRLAKPLSNGPIFEKDEFKRTIDLDTTWAVLNDRFNVMAQFRDSVVAPLAQSLANVTPDKKSLRLLRRAKRLICRDETQIKQKEQENLQTLISRFPVLKSIYDQRVALTKVCEKRSASREELLASFKEWCANAEASGLQVMQDFVSDLRCYTMPRARA